MSYVFTRHVMEVIESKGFNLSDIQDVLVNYETSYESNTHPGQRKYIGRGLCVVVDEERGRVVTVFKHMEITPLREDQKKNGVRIR